MQVNEFPKYELTRLHTHNTNSKTDRRQIDIAVLRQINPEASKVTATFVMNDTRD